MACDAYEVCRFGLAGLFKKQKIPPVAAVI